MKKKVATILVSMFSLALMNAQTASDILRYSYLNQQGTARSMGIGNAIGGLGGDFTSLSINPAGIGGYWKSEFMVTPSYLSILTDATLTEGFSETERTNNFNVSNVGIVFTNQPNRGNWKSVSLGFGLNKQNNYNQEQFFLGESSGSITDRFAGLAFGLAPDDLDGFEAGIAYETGAIFDFENDGIYETDFLGNQQQAFRKQQLSTYSGYMNEMVISFGGNLKDKILLGTTIGIPFVKYTSEQSYKESDDLDVIPAFNALAFDEFLNTEGGGVNIKLGLIAKLGKQFRIGAAFHSPTYLSLTDRFSTDLTYDFIQGGIAESFQSLSPDGEFEYALITPWRAVGSFSAIFGKHGFVSTDIEFVDYSAARYDFTTNSDNFEDRQYQELINSEIDLLYGGAINVRLGGELAFESLRLRGGLQLLSSPFKDDNTMQSIISLGGGVRGNKAFLDLAFNYSSQKETYLPYQVDGAPNQLVNTTLSRSQFLLTLGFKI